MYTADHVFPVQPIKDLINEDGELATPFKLTTGTKPSILYLRVIFFMCFTKNYCTCYENGVKYAPPIAKVFLWYIHCYSTESKSISCLCTTQTEDHIFIKYCFYENFFSLLKYTSQPYAETISMQLDTSYIPYDIFQKENNADIIAFALFEEVNLI